MIIDSGDFKVATRAQTQDGFCDGEPDGKEYVFDACGVRIVVRARIWRGDPPLDPEPWATTYVTITRGGSETETDAGPEAPGYIRVRVNGSDEYDFNADGSRDT